MIQVKGGMECDDVTFHCTSPGDMQLKTYELFLEFPFKVLDNGWLWITETTVKLWIRGQGLLYTNITDDMTSLREVIFFLVAPFPYKTDEAGGKGTLQNNCEF